MTRDHYTTADEVADAAADHAAPAVSIARDQLTTPDDCDVRPPRFRDRNYAACLPGDIAAAIDDLDGTALGPGRSSTAGMLTGSPRHEVRRNDPEDDAYLGPVAARKESVRAALALLVDETAARVVEDVADVEREPYLKPGERTAGFGTTTKAFIGYTTARDRVLSPSRSGTPRELPNGWPRSVTALDWWRETVQPAVERLPGVEPTTYGRGRDKPAIEFTPSYEQDVRRGVLKAAGVDPGLADALGFDEDPEAVRAAILDEPTADQPADQSADPEPHEA